MSAQTLQIETITPDITVNRNAARDNSYAFAEIRKIELSKIRVRDGFNVRQDYGDIKQLAQSIIENGQSQPGRVDAISDSENDNETVFLLVDGHRRFEALKLLESQGNECYFIAIVNKQKTTEEQRIIQMFTTQDNKQLEPIEAAEIIQRLANLGHKGNYIAKKIGKPASYVSNMLALAAESPHIKKHVEDGNVTVSAVLKAQKSTPNQKERVEKVEAAVNTAKEKSVNGTPKKNATAAAVTKELAAPEVAKKAKKIFKALMTDARMKTIECEEGHSLEEVMVEIISKYL